MTSSRWNTIHSYLCYVHDSIFSFLWFRRLSHQVLNISIKIWWKSSIDFFKTVNFMHVVFGIILIKKLVSIGIYHNYVYTFTHTETSSLITRQTDDYKTKNSYLRFVKFPSQKMITCCVGDGVSFPGRFLLNRASVLNKEIFKWKWVSYTAVKVEWWTNNSNYKIHTQEQSGAHIIDNRNHYRIVWLMLLRLLSSS